MSISPKAIKILWTAAAGRCAFPDCRMKLAIYEAGEFAPYTLGQMAHICGEKPDASRHDPGQTPQERDDYQNLILLCPTHHVLIDRPENEEKFSVAMLHEMKGTHEAYINSKLDAAPFETKSAVAREIMPFLAENHQVWLQYGPLSELARKNPHNAAAHAVWMSERLSTIVPNNRRIEEILSDNIKMFSPDEQATISKFMLHTRSYEQWVQDEMSYEGVIRFPEDFETLIKEHADAGL